MPAHERVGRRPSAPTAPGLAEDAGVAPMDDWGRKPAAGGPKVVNLPSAEVSR